MEAATTLTTRLDSPFLRALRDTVGPQRLTWAVLERLVQQQLVHGGTLDTLVLETGVATEDEVATALVVANGTRPIAAAQLAAPTAEAMGRVPGRVATRLGFLPLFVEDDADDPTGSRLHIACAGPIDAVLCAEFGALLGVAVEAHVVPEVRVKAGLHRTLGAPLPERYVALLELLDRQRPVARTNSAPSSSLVADRTVGRTPAPEAAAVVTLSPGAAPSLPPIGSTGDVELVEWELVEALAHLAAQDSRDGIARVATTYARRFLPFAAVFGVRDGMLIGWARSGTADGALFSSRALPLPVDSFVAAVLSSTSPYLGPVAPGPGNDAVLGWLGRRRPRTVVLAPVHVAGRVVAALWADDGVRGREPRELGELVAFSVGLGGAFEALLRQRQRQHPSLFPMPAGRMQGAAGAMPGAASTTAPNTATTTTAIASIAALVPPTTPVRMPRVADHELGARGVDGTGILAGAAGRSLTVPMAATATATTATAATATAATATAATATAATATAPADAAVASDRARPASIDGVEIPVPSLLQDDRGNGGSDGGGAAGTWRAALHDTLERGLQSGAVDESEGWEDISWNTPVLPAAGVTTASSFGARRAASGADDGDLAAAAMGASHEQPGGPTPDVDVPSGDGDEDNDDDDLGGIDEMTPVDRSSMTLSDAALVVLLCGEDDDEAAGAARVLATRGVAVVPALAERFPGPLRLDPLRAEREVRSPTILGPLLGVLARFGKAGLDAALPHLDSRSATHRFAAVALFAHTPDVRALELLRARLYDPEPRIRSLTIDAMRPFLTHPRFERLLMHLRERVVTERFVPTESRRRAAELLGIFRDVGAVPLLIEQLKGPLADTAREALQAITLQDHGDRTRPWEKWWSRAKKASRVDWLIEALAADELDRRRAAHNELRAFTGDDLGYRPDAERRVRDRAVSVWQQWWADERRSGPPHGGDQGRTAGR